MTAPRAVRSVAILGGGIVGLTAARAFARALPQVAVTVVETPPDPAALADRLPGTLPAINPFHAWIGIDEATLARERVATYRLGTRFSGWSADGSDWVHAYGDHGLPAAGIPFHQLWARADARGAAPSFDRFCAAAALLRAGKFVHPQPDPGSSLSTYDYALRLDPDAYRALLRRDLSARTVAGSLGGMERRDDGGVAALILSDGRRVEADLFVDCAGPAAPLLSALDPSFESWDFWLPCDRLLLARGAGAEATSGDDVAAIDIGWRWRDGDFAALAHNSGTKEDRARQAFGETQAEPISIRTGRRPHPWIRNVVAIGDAAVAVDPLESTNLALAHNAIRRMLDLLPTRDCLDVELSEYRRRSGDEAMRVRDFLALHYLRSGRGEGAFWLGLQDRALPESLAHTIDQFEARGRLPFFEEELFDRDSWLAVLFGLGIRPRAQQPTAARVDPARSDPAIKAFADRLAALPAQLPTYRDYLARLVR